MCVRVRVCVCVIANINGRKKQLQSLEPTPRAAFFSILGMASSLTGVESRYLIVQQSSVREALDTNRQQFCVLMEF